MPIVDYTPVLLSPAGVDLAQENANADGGYNVLNSGRCFLLITNTSGSAVTVQIETPGTVDPGLDVEDLQVTVPANTGNKLLGPFLPGTFNSAGRMKVTFPGLVATTSAVKFGAWRID